MKENLNEGSLDTGSTSPLDSSRYTPNTSLYIPLGQYPNVEVSVSRFRHSAIHHSSYIKVHLMRLVRGSNREARSVLVNPYSND